MTDRRAWPVRVGKVSYGRGVFARRAFTPGDIVGEVRGEVIDDENYSSSTCIDLMGSLSLEPAAPFCYLNHSCEPNCQFWLIDDEDLALFSPEGRGERSSEDPVESLFATGLLLEREREENGCPHVLLECLRPIARGAQLTIDYSWPAENAMRCACGSLNCRGWIVSEEELDQVDRTAAEHPESESVPL